MRLLLVGVGGVGCEFLDLLLNSRYNFDKITLVDPDIIEASNLPRQRLFSPRQIGLPKAQIAAEALLKANFNVEYHLCTIESLPEPLFKDFDAVVMAVDSVPTRRWLNAALLQQTSPPRIIIDVGVEGFKASCRIWRSGSNSACLECSFGLLLGEEETLPVCSLYGQPRNIQDCLLYAMATSENDKIIPAAINRAHQFNFPVDESSLPALLARLQSTAIPAVASVNALIAVKALQLLTDACNQESIYFLNCESGVYWQSLQLEIDPLCPFCN